MTAKDSPAREARNLASGKAIQIIVATDATAQCPGSSASGSRPGNGYYLWEMKYPHSPTAGALLHAAFAVSRLSGCTTFSQPDPMLSSAVCPVYRAHCGLDQVHDPCPTERQIICGMPSTNARSQAPLSRETTKSAALFKALPCSQLT